MRWLARRNHSWTAWAVVAPLVVSCSSGESNSPWCGTVADSAGVVVVNNPAEGLWASTETWRLEEDLVVGVATGDPDFEFGHISALDIGSDGSIYVLDDQARQVRVFDSTGAATHRFGGPGSGPGELGLAVLSILIGLADTIFVPDQLTDRINVYLPSGEPQNSLPHPRAAGGTAWSWAVQPSGSLLYRGFSLEWDGILRYSRSGAVPDTVMRFDYTFDIPEIGGDLGSGSFRVVDEVLRVLPSYHVLKDGRIATGTTDAYRIYVHRPDGTLERVINRPEGRRAISPADEQAIEDLWGRRSRAQFIPQEMRANYAIALPDSFPAFASISEGPDGTLWVQQIAQPSDMDPDGLGDLSYERLGSRTWDVFDRDGRYLGAVTLPYTLRLLRTRGDFVYGVAKGPYDEDRVVRLRVLQ